MKKEDFKKGNLKAEELIGFIDSNKDCYWNLLRLFAGDGDEGTHFFSEVSSSRMCFLFFASLGKGITLNLKGKKITFTKSYLEVKNTVIRYNNPSNVDVLLVSDDGKNLLYLESKFTEYICNGGKRDKKEAQLGKSYFYSDKEYTPLIDFLSGETDSNDKKFISKQSGDVTDGEPQAKRHMYYGGLKQMISHFIGVWQGPSKKDSQHDELMKLWKGADKIYLGTILFELEDKTKDSKERYFDLYSEAYKKLAQSLNEFKNEFKKEKQGDKVLKNITVIEKPLTYQELLDENPHLGTIEEKVKQFYHLNQDKLEEDKSQES
jgi:hypothetical protein